MHDRFQDLLDADSHFRARINRFLGRNGKNFLELSVHRRDVGIRQIDFVDDRYDREALFVREMHVRDGLRLHALCGIDDEQRTFAGRERARDFIGEIDVPRRVEQIEPVFLSRLARVPHRDRMRFNRDSALAFEIHRIEQLILLVALVDRAGALEQSIRKRCLAVIDMRDDAEIPGQLDRHKALHYAGASSVGQSGGPCLNRGHPEPHRRRGTSQLLERFRETFGANFGPGVTVF